MNAGGGSISANQSDGHTDDPNCETPSTAACAASSAHDDDIPRLQTRRLSFASTNSSTTTGDGVRSGTSTLEATAPPSRPSLHEDLNLIALRFATERSRWLVASADRQATVHLIRGNLGPGALALPAAFARAGWVASFLCMVAVFVQGVWAMLLISRLRRALGPRGARSLGDIVRLSLGARAARAIDIIVFVVQVPRRA